MNEPALLLLLEVDWLPNNVKAGPVGRLKSMATMLTINEPLLVRFVTLLYELVIVAAIVVPGVLDVVELKFRA